MSDIPHPGFGGVTFTRDNECVFPWGDLYDEDADWARTFQDYEEVAVGDPEPHDWRIRIDGPLSGYTYQRQGQGVWALVEQGQGFA